MKNRFLALDGFRLLCALSVAAFHYGVSWNIDGVQPATYLFPGAGHIMVYGCLGVEAFFLISGFVICMSSWGRTTTDYLISRAGRLYPAFWVCVLLSALVITALPVTRGVVATWVPTPAEIGWNLTMVPQPLGVRMVDTVYWTLWVELRFYLIFALLTLGGLTYNRVAAFCLVWLAAAIFVPNELVVMPSYGPYFVAGIAIYLMHRFRPTPLLWVIVTAAWIMNLRNIHDFVATLRPGWEVPFWPAALIITACHLFLIAVAIGPLGRITAGAAWLSVAGALTYPFYLLHQRIGYSLIRAGHDHTPLPGAVLLFGTAGVVLGAAWLVHRYVERPLMPLLRRGLRAVVKVPPEREAVRS